MRFYRGLLVWLVWRLPVLVNTFMGLFMNHHRTKSLMGHNLTQKDFINILQQALWLYNLLFKPTHKKSSKFNTRIPETWMSEVLTTVDTQAICMLTYKAQAVILHTVWYMWAWIPRICVTCDKFIPPFWKFRNSHEVHIRLINLTLGDTFKQYMYITRRLNKFVKVVCQFF